MKLEGALTEVRRVSRASDPWTGGDFTCAQPEHDPATIDHAIAAILNAVASGELVPLADHRLAVALAYQRAAYAVSESAEWPEDANDHTMCPAMFARVVNAILALADPDALAEVQALRAERDDRNREMLSMERLGIERRDRAEAADAEFAMARTDADQTRIALRAAEAEVARLREALQKIARQKLTTELETELDVENADFEGGYDKCINVARAALKPKAAT